MSRRLTFPRSLPPAALLLAGPLLIALPLAGPGCRTDQQKQDDGLRQGQAIYDLVEKTWPRHTTYELDHQLLVRTEDPERVMKLLDLQPGEVAADVGCGSGFYTWRFSAAVGPTGRVWATDIQQAAIDYLTARLQDDPPPTAANIRIALTKADDAMIPPSTLDAALLSHSDFYAYEHLLPENVRMLESLAAALKPGGRLVVIQDMTVLQKVGTPQFITANLAQVGLVEEVFQHEGDPGEVYARYRKPGA